MTQARLLALAALGAAALVVACSDRSVPVSPAGPLAQILPAGTPLPAPGDGVADGEEYELCKVGSAATFNWTMTTFLDANLTPGPVTSGSITMNDGECWVILRADVQSHPAEISITEQVPTGYHIAGVDVSIIRSSGLTTTTRPGPTIVDTAWGGHGGILAKYYNVQDPPPPPPPGGGEGCTPGYWKQTQHFDSWPAPYQPNQLFSSVFEDAFPGMTLLQVLGLGGGGLNALGRHTVSALLSSGSVNYAFSAQDVIDAFNAVYPGGDYEGQKNIFAAQNELTCPLN